MSSLYDEGVKNIKENDRELQKRLLTTLSKYRFMNVDYMLDKGCFFVPNPDYLKEMFGIGCVSPANDFYDYDGNCKFLGTLMMPIRNVNDSIVGFTSFNPIAKIQEQEYYSGESNERPGVKYKVSSSKVFDRNRFPLIPNGYDKMLRDGYVIITDGNFDAYTLASYGLNTFCNMGSSFGQYTAFILSFVKKRFVARDNDRAGLVLFNAINSKLPGTKSLLQNKYKDIDEYFSHLDNSEETIKFIKSRIDNKVIADIMLK